MSRLLNFSLLISEAILLRSRYSANRGWQVKQSIAGHRQHEPLILGRTKMGKS